MATIFIADGKAAISASFEQKDQCKSIQGARWHAASRTWRYPLSVETCLDARQAFGDDLDIDPELAQWYVQEKAGRVQQTALASQEDAELRFLPTYLPALAATLRPDQRAGALWVANGYRNAGLLADAPGTGKTIETIAGLMERYAGTDRPVNILITCPKVSVKNVWGRDFGKWAPIASVHLARGTRGQREMALRRFAEDDSRIRVLVIVAEMTRVKETPVCLDADTGREVKVCTGPEMHANHVDEPTGKKRIYGYEYPELFDTKWDTIVVDESQRWMGSLTVVKGTLAAKGFKRLPQPTDGYRLAVSATPFGKGGRVQGMFGTLHWLWPDEFTSFWRWAGRHFEIEEEIIRVRGGGTRETKRVKGLRRGTTDNDFFASLGPRVLRRTKAEVLAFLPPKQYVEVLCEMVPKQARQYAQLVADAEIKTNDGVITPNGALAQLTRAKQVSDGEITLAPNGIDVRFTGESGKLEALWEKLEARGIVGEDQGGDTKVIVASQFNQLLVPLQWKLEEAGVPYHILTGATSDTKRDAAMDAFQAEGGARVFLLNAKAGGVSITLDAADEVHCLDELWNPEDQEQLEDRAHRASRTHQVTIYQYRSEDTIDQAIAEDVEVKRREQHDVLDGRRGMDYIREMITTPYKKAKAAA